MGEPLERRLKESSNRCLKLLLTDGHQQAVAMEYRRVSDLKLEMAAGSKIAIHDVMVKRGILFLCS
eukprot:CAMPEP_0114632132 /NCGR_PEP_ID=MMETSP0168-20121206/14770_1 /TAXON_ID=95228 ORGANISM="Vannella sp., Strain DIVA3 517/6/12" /NCGR_SAMPLE_ID=MMETSP0168 /ASSEMBLY_ACC=CAM_ASM_000044 /LENGTH=65 /DNA_ID=CAMNT_0001843719 /DNA_START=75 /DNA_END=269 /DNA_ORIENTATION=+